MFADDKQNIVAVNVTAEHFALDRLISRFSSWTKLKIIIVWTMLAKRKLSRHICVGGLVIIVGTSPRTTCGALGE